MFKKLSYNIPKGIKTLWGRDGRKDDDLARLAAHSCETFSYNTLAAATHNFDTDNLIGKGAFGPTYKGRLPDGREIAVKRISKTFSEGRSAFNNEIELLCRLHHRNVVKLYGYCAHNDECLLLVYEYVPHGSLDQHLFNPDRSSELLDWRLRYQIIIGIAKGLSYLHGDSQNGSIIHRDIKSTVILLDNKWNPKISDFGIGRQLLEDRTHLTTAIAGTMGYLAPESLVHGHVTVKTDIFSFGVLMLELISGKKPYRRLLNDDDPGLLHWAHQLYEENRILELMNPTLEDSADIEQVTNCIKIGLLCTQDDPVRRPDIDRVMSMLTGNQVVAEIPVIRSRFFRPILSDDDESQISYSDGSEFEDADSAASDTHGHMPAGDQQIQHVLSNSIQLMQDGRVGRETLNDPLQRPHMDGVVTMSVGNQGDEFEETVNIEEEIPDHIPMDEQQIHDGPSNSNQPMQDDPHSNSFTAHAQDFRERHEDENFENKIAAQNCQKFSFETLCDATNEFASQNMLGQGNFGLVYKGTLNDGKEIAVKKSLGMSEQHRNSLITEVELLSRLKHPNVVKLLGYCVDDTQFSLVYDYVPNKSLDKLLFDSSGRKHELDWATTYNIILGIARGLSYLHADSQNRIIHRDIKADNILIDHKWEPKIADFGISRLFDANQTHVFTNLAGTRGYWAPEYAMQQHLTVKADVYSFGVLVIELITGKRNLSLPPPENYRGGRFDWANKLLKRNKISEIMDPALKKDSADMKQVVNCIEIGLHCTQFDPKKRPKMENVVSKLIGYDGLRESRRSGLFG